jgi:putative glutamine amidotransferase|tara:strand:+ start:650 stop:1315 length:666 start_codon:yes stop_codon:yes gene_type:complete
MRTMTHKPKIGISLRVVQAPNYDEKRDALSQDWSSLLEELGFIPVFIPNTLGSLENFLEEISLDGLVLSGGDNIGENQGRDETENKLLMYAIEKKIPVIGVCRGMQLINVYFGGKLSIDDSTIHLAKKHNIEITDTNFSSLFKSSSFHVNTYHKNMIRTEGMGDGLKSFAIFSKDNSIEGFFHEKLPIIGVMWHPERDPDSNNKVILSAVLKNKNFWKNQL